MGNEMLPHTKNLEMHLNAIGFTLRHCGCGFYQIYNPSGERTLFEVVDDRLKLRDAGVMGVFGKNGRGGVAFNLRDCRIVQDEKTRAVSVIGNESNTVFVNFYEWF